MPPTNPPQTPYPLIDSDPHFSRVVRYFRLSDYAWWATGTAAFPGTLFLWDSWDKSGVSLARMRPYYRLSGLLGFVGGFLLAYQRSSFRFWGWTENKHEEDKDFKELSQRAREGKPLYGESNQPQWVQAVAHSYSAYSQLKFQALPWFNFVNHPYHGVDPAKYGVKVEKKESESKE